MIPWFESQVFHIGPIPFQTWGTLVALGFILGVWLSAKRTARRGFDKKMVWEWAFWFLLFGFIGARLFHVLFYDPSYYLNHPLDVIDPRRQGFAIFGSFIAGALVVLWMVYRKRIKFLAFADAIIWGLPWGVFIGRLGCFLIHDHPGTISTFFLAVSYPDGIGRHDLGLYLSLSGLAMGLIFLLLDRKPRSVGTFLAAYMIMEGLTRLWLDFYRLADARYFSLTPAQWFSFVLIAGGIWLFSKIRKKPAVLIKNHGLADVASDSAEC